MVRYLTQEWLDRERELSQELPPAPGATGRVQHVVTGTPDGDVNHHRRVDDGIIAESALGTDADAEVTVTTPYAEWVQILRGELDANAAFMQGRVKVAGAMGTLLPLMVLSRTEERRRARAALAEETELPD